MQIKMIVCDLDGTLLRDDKTISPRTLEILHRVKGLGIKFAIATARHALGSAAEHKAVLRPDAVIHIGGAEAKIGGKTVFSASLADKTAWALANAMLARGDATRILAEGADFFQSDFALDFPGPVYKVSARFAKPLGDFGKNFDDVGIIQYRGEDLAAFTHSEARKWRAVQACADFFDIDTEEVAAFGDDAIDVEMLAKCGIGVAVANAVPQALAVAKYVCKCNEKDGVAVWLEENIVSDKRR